MLSKEEVYEKYKIMIKFAVLAPKLSKCGNDAYAMALAYGTVLGFEPDRVNNEYEEYQKKVEERKMKMAQEYASLMYQTLKSREIDIHKEGFFAMNNSEGYSHFQDEVAHKVLSQYADNDYIENYIDTLIDEGDVEFGKYFVNEEYGVNASDGVGEWLPEYEY